MIFDIASQQQLPEVFNSKQTTMANELGLKADLILGRAPAVVDYRRQFSVDFANPRQIQLNTLFVGNFHRRRLVYFLVLFFSDTKTRTNNNEQQKTRSTVDIEQLVPFILKVRKKKQKKGDVFVVF